MRAPTRMWRQSSVPGCAERRWPRPIPRAWRQAFWPRREAPTHRNIGYFLSGTRPPNATENGRCSTLRKRLSLQITGGLNMAGRAFDVSQLIDTRPFGALQVRIVVLCTFVALLDGMDLQSIGLAA